MPDSWYPKLRPVPMVRIGELVRTLDESEATLRWWEKELRIFVHRTKSGHRVYDERAQNKLRLAKQLIRKEGMTLRGAKLRIWELENL